MAFPPHDMPSLSPSRSNAKTSNAALVSPETIAAPDEAKNTVRPSALTETPSQSGCRARSPPASATQVCRSNTGGRTAGPSAQ